MSDYGIRLVITDRQYRRVLLVLHGTVQSLPCVPVAMESLRRSFRTVSRWEPILHVVMDAEWLRSYERRVKERSIPEGLLVADTIRRRQYYLNKVLRRLGAAAA